MSAGERAWADDALRASDDVMLTRLHLQPDPRPTIDSFQRPLPVRSESLVRAQVDR